MQEDILLDCMTPRESLTFAARLKLKNTTKEKIEKRVENLIRQVIKNIYLVRIGKMCRYIYRKC